MDQDQLREEMVRLAKGLMGGGFAPAVYEQIAEDFVQMAIQYAQAQTGPPMKTELDWPTAREWLNGQMARPDGLPYEL